MKSIKGTSPVELQCANAKSAKLEACDAAMNATATANEANTHADHTTAARLHRIAAEHCALEADDAGHEKHKGMAVEHDLCASKCLAAAQNKVSEPSPVLTPALARRSFSGKKPLEAGEGLLSKDQDVICKMCNHQFKLVDGEKFTKEHVKCPSCQERVNVASSRKEDLDENQKKLADDDDGSGVDKLPTYESKAMKAFIDKVNELVAARLVKNKPLEAGLAGNGWSLNDLNSDVREAIQRLDICKSTSTQNNLCGPCGWVCDIVAPEHEAGETWSAIVQGNDGKLYAVQFTVGDDVKIVGDPKEVERTSEYDYADEIETQARKASGLKALEAGAPMGNQNARKGAAKAHSLSEGATIASDRAAKELSDESHEEAKVAHAKAAAAHSDVASMHDDASSKFKLHDAIARSHEEQAAYHESKQSGFAAKSSVPHTEKTSPTGMSAKKHSDAAADMKKQALEHASGMRATTYASHATGEAGSASKVANDSGSANDHFHAATAHSAAEDAQRHASKMHMNGGSGSQAAIAKQHADNHNAKFAEHMAAVRKIRSSLGASRETIAVKECLNAMKNNGINPDLNGVRHEVLRTRGIDLTCEQVAKAIAEPLAASHAHGVCPKCGDDSHQETESAHGGQGETVTCGACVVTTKSADWKMEARRFGKIDGAGRVSASRAVAIDTRPDAAVALDASNELTAGKGDDLRSRLEGDALPDVIMYMPGGLHRITPSQGGRPVTVVVQVDAQSAEDIEEQRKALTSDQARPFFSVQHSTQIAAFWPTKFFWDKRLDATGSLVEGVWAEGEWTKSGREAVEGKDFRTFSPTFFVDAVRNDEENPARIVCNADAKLNMGALENDPAFQAISPLWAKNASTKATESVRGLVRRMHEELRARFDTKFTLRDVKRALEAKGTKMSEDEIGKHLMKLMTPAMVSA